MSSISSRARACMARTRLLGLCAGRGVLRPLLRVRVPRRLRGPGIEQLRARGGAERAGRGRVATHLECVVTRALPSWLGSPLSGLFYMLLP